MRVLVFALALISLALAGCVTVRPEQRSVLADPIMRFGDEASQAQGQYRHAIDNREGSTGGSGVTGGGCGCN
jgi:hypothetical protein